MECDLPYVRPVRTRKVLAGWLEEMMLEEMMTDDAAWSLAQHVCRTGSADAFSSVWASRQYLGGVDQGL
jgi:hypothetical protein